MSMNPIITTRKIKEDYLDYLKSIMTVKNEEIRSKLYKAVDESTFVKGPFLEATPPYVTGENLNDLIQSGIASNEFGKLAKSVDLYRPLYKHQEKAFKKVVSQKRNIVVATGTGSGKTESFMYPIFNQIMEEIENGSIDDGVRALFMYPMNALANDQMKRLRELLKDYPQITFGRYTGETEEKESNALEKYRVKKEKEIKAKNKYALKGIDYDDNDINPLPNERISREAMRDNPPHILLTNYAMLEFLLIRPNDNVFFSGESGKSWKFIVIDEAHTYKGANGTEIALLLRRLKERICLNKRGKIQCIATSATLGDPSALPELAKFASAIFDEVFEVDDIIISERIVRNREEKMKRGTPEEYCNLMAKALEMTEEAYERLLFDNLCIDERIMHIMNALEQKPKSLDDVADSVFHDMENQIERKNALVNLIQLGVRAKHDKDSVALLPARYHLFIKALEGVYISLYPEKRVFLDRREHIGSINGMKVPVFELSNCQHCGQEYLIGIEKEGKLCPPSSEQKPDYFMLANTQAEELEIDANSDDEIVEVSKVNKIEYYELCTACGKLARANMVKKSNCCDCSDPDKIIKVYKIKTKNMEPNTCVACGSVSPSIIKRFMTANQPATYIVAQSLYSMIPPQKIEIKREEAKQTGLFKKQVQVMDADYYDEGGRKLLVFSDNRQEAAFFAAYMDNKYNQMMWRRLILKELRNKPEGYMIDDFIGIAVNIADRNGLFSSEDTLTLTKKRNIAWVYILKEFLVFERHQGLEGNGYVRFYPESMGIEDGYWGLTEIEMQDLINIFMDSFRIAGAVSFPDTVSIEDEVFEPRNRSVYFRKQNGDKEKSGYLSFMPVGKSSNRRYDFMKKLLKKTGCVEEEIHNMANTKLEEMYGIFMELAAMGYLQQNANAAAGVGYKLEYRKWRIAYIFENEKIYICKKCKKKSNYNVKGICTEFRCDGELESIKAVDYRKDPYYTKMYSEDKLIPMISEEHTAQLNKDEAGNLQTKFENGQVNVLSCSTTFEMGVDVGQLEAIFLRNMPPETSNYIQRAGRAGRRTSATAFSVTYAKRSSHDLNYFINPIEIISGNIKSPYIELNNDKIASRHINSIVMAWFFRNNPSYFNGKVRFMIGEDKQESIIEALKKDLEERPEELIRSIDRVLPTHLFERLDIQNWKFVDQLIGEDGALTNAIRQTISDKEALEEILEERRARAGNNNVYQDDIVRHIDTICSTTSINYLASNSVIPKYGFPVDVVKLDILNNSRSAKAVDLSRDLKQAISEYAPGSEIIAAGNVWTSRYLNRIRDKEWPTYSYFECTKCHKTKISEEPTSLEEDDSEIMEVCNCGTPMRAQKFIIPIFGFSTKYGEDPKRVGDKRPSRAYSTKIQFAGLDKLDQLQEQEQVYSLIQIGRKQIKSMYSPQGRLVLLNKGLSKSGLFVCPWCGYAQSNAKDFDNHTNKFGRKCGNSFYKHVALGHSFNSDILRLEFPNYIPKPQGECDLWTSLLYAIIEGASDALGISRSDINGCIDYISLNPALILFDESSGGAGHVKQIANKLEQVLKAAYRRVYGKCGCGEETSCYGCLRGYTNQFDHEHISRGMAKEYLEWILIKGRVEEEVSYKIINKDSYYNTQVFMQIAVSEEKGIDIGEEWKELLQLLISPGEKPYYDLVQKCAEHKVQVLPKIGYELVSTEWGVLGYEAELAWEEYKLAIVRDEMSFEAFKNVGWKTYHIEEVDVDKILGIIR